MDYAISKDTNRGISTKVAVFKSFTRFCSSRKLLLYVVMYVRLLFMKDTLINTPLPLQPSAGEQNQKFTKIPPSHFAFIIRQIIKTSYTSHTLTKYIYIY